MSAELDYPAWPPGLTDSTPLPFAYWRVMHLTDGQRSIDRLVQTLGSTDAYVRQVLSEVRRSLERAAAREQPVTQAAQDALRQSLISVMGPMGDLVIDDALDDLPENTSLAALLAHVNAQLSASQSQTLASLLRTKGIA
jgi:hypothetical protein